MSGEMDVHPLRYEFDFEELKATEGYNPPEDFLTRVLPLHAGGALPPGGKTKERIWYEYPSPFGKDWNLQSKQLQLELEEKLERRDLEERKRQRQRHLLKLHMLKHNKETQHQEESQGQQQDWDLLQHQEETELQLEELTLRLGLEDMLRRRLDAVQVYGNSVEDFLRQCLDAVQQRLLDKVQQRLLGKIQPHYHQEGHMDAVLPRRISRRARRRLRLAREEKIRLRQEKDDIFMDEIRANSSNSECWGLDDKAPTYSSSPARDVSQEHQLQVEDQLQVEEHQFHVEEHLVRLDMWEKDAANIPRWGLFNCEANINDLLLESPLEIPYYIYAGRCNLNLEGYKLRYADLFPDFHSWSSSWVRPTTYKGDSQYVNFWSELMEEVEYTNTKDRVLAKAIAIANKSFRKMLYFQIELAVKDCMMLLEHDKKMEQTCHLYGYIASEIYFKKQQYESVLERIMNGHEVLRYELTELGRDANEDDAWEMREFVDHLVRSTPIELPHATRFDDEYKKWVYKQLNLQTRYDFDLYVNYLVEKLNTAQDLDLAPDDTNW